MNATIEKPSAEGKPAPAAASNLNVRQLAATLSKVSAPGEGTADRQVRPTEREPAAAAATAPEKPADSHERPAGTEGTGSLTTVEGEETEVTETTEANKTTEARPDAETAAEEEAGEDGLKPGLPAEILEAIEIAKAQDGGKGKAEMLKRIHKLTDARDTERNARLTAEEQNAQLRTELQQAKADRQVSPTSAPQGTHPEVAKVQEELNNVDHWLGWCEEQLPKLQSGEVETVEVPDGKGGKIAVGVKEVAKTRRDLENLRQEVVARKVQTEGAVKTAFNEAYNKSHAAALTSYPWLKQETAPEYQAFQQILKIMPGFKNLPDHELAIGDFLAGKALREGKADRQVSPTKKAAPSREPTRVTTEAPNGGADTEETPEKEAKQSTQQFQKSGSTRDLARALTASRRASRTTKR